MRLKKELKAWYSPPNRFECEDFTIMLALNKFLEIMKTLENFGFVAQKINPSKFTVIVDEANIVAVSSNRSWSRSPYIRMNKVQGTR
jgi:hypothetical protein